MPESLLPQKSVYNGVWNEISPHDGRATLTLTLSNNNAFVLISVLAVLIAYAGARSWKIMRAIVYLCMTSCEENRFTREQQVILRNSHSAIDTCTSYVRFCFNHRHSLLECRGLLHITIVILLALVFASGFLFCAAWFSKPITHNRVRIKPTDDCGYWALNTSRIEQLATLNQLPDQSELYGQLNQLAQFAINGSALAASYVDSCYGDEAFNDSCDLMFTRRISWNASQNDSCPFAKGQCVGGDTSAYTMDTGNVSFASLGVNVRTTLSFHRRTTCSPIVMEPYQVSPGAAPGGTYSHVKYLGRNITETVRDDVAAAYQINAWTPRIGTEVYPNLQPEVGNVSIVYISRNNLKHLHWTDQPIFSATEGAELIPVYFGYTPKWEKRLGAIGCVEKLQMCRQKPKEECSPWTGVVKGGNGWTGIEDFFNRSSDIERGLISLMLPDHTVLQTIADAARGSGASLVASRSLISLPLLEGRLTELQTSDEKEQWKREVAQWFNVVLSVIQLAGTYFPTKPPFLNRSLMVNEMKNESRFICHSIKINSLDNTSINFEAIIAILGAITFITAVSFMDELPSRLPWHWWGKILSQRWRADTPLTLLGSQDRDRSNNSAETYPLMGMDQNQTIASQGAGGQEVQAGLNELRASSRHTV